MQVNLNQLPLESGSKQRMNEMNEMSEDAQKLLMMFIVDGYSSTGKVSKKTALAMMRYVASDKELQGLVNNSDNKTILNHKSA